MPKINVYLSDELAEAVKEAGLPVSPICQRALEGAVRQVAAIREAAGKVDLGDLENDDGPHHQLQRFTQRARTAVKNAASLARQSGADKVRTEHLLLGILDENSNLALQVLRSMDIEPDDLREELADTIAVAGAESTTRQFDEPTATAMTNALSEAISMAHNYIGCEHLLLGLIAEPDGAAGTVLRSRGAELRVTRKAVSAMLAGFVYAQSKERAQVPGADALREALQKIVQRLDKLEDTVTRLDGGQS